MMTAMSAFVLSRHRPWLIAVLCLVSTLLAGCAGSSSILDTQTAALAPLLRSNGARAAPSLTQPVVILYASPVAQAYWTTTEFDGRINVQLWQVFLRKYKIPFLLMTSVEQLEQTAIKTLILPSAVALSERERKAISGFRAKGGGVLTSWLTGMRDERGRDIGFQFMENTLGVKVIGNTENDAKDNFLITHGDSPVTHHLPAGMRIWLDRVKGLYPLRLSGQNTAAHIMDWSRKASLDKVTGTVVFDERAEESGLRSRSVSLGYSEQLWVSADPQLLEALTHNALMWVLRVPSAYTGAWPHPYRSALVLAIDVAGALSNRDLENAKRMEQAGGRATYYVVSDTAAKSSEKLVGLQSKGHEIAFLGDKYNDFREQAADVQGQRLDSMLNVMSQHGLVISRQSGFHPPMDSYDINTEKLLRERDFGYLLGTMDTSEARLPFSSTGRIGLRLADQSSRADSSTSMLVLPRTQEGPDELVDNCNPEVGLKLFYKELQLSENMAGLSVIPLPSRNELTDAQHTDIFNYIGTRREHKWLATANQVAHWWRERERVQIRLESVNRTQRLSVTIAPGPALTQAPVILVNLPWMGSSLRLITHGNATTTPRIVAADEWRAALVLDGFPPGEYQWELLFDGAISGGANL